MSAGHDPSFARDELRKRLVEDRVNFAVGPAAAGAARSLERALKAVLAELEAQCLGAYWPRRGEFNAAACLWADEGLARGTQALPFARRIPRDMHYRLWDGGAPAVIDEWGIPSSDGAVVIPDVVLVPCVGFTAAGHRLGYGGGYYDRWLAAHAHVVAVGVAWALSEVDSAAFAAQAHDVPLALIVTEHGVR